MKITVIIPTFKPHQYIEECLQALDKQTLDKDCYEVLIILNGEKEPYYSDILKIVKKCSCHSRLLYTDVTGVSNARNIGLDNAQGEYVAFIDDDDFVSPSYLQELLEKASPTTVSLCYPYAFIDGDMRQLAYNITETYETHFSEYNQPFSFKIRKYFNGPCMKLIPMSFIQKRRFDIRLMNGEDTLFMFQISDKIKQVSFTSQTAIYYRRFRTESATTRKRCLGDRFHSNAVQIFAYTKIYLKNPLKYDFIFYLSRCGGAIIDIGNAIFQSFMKNHKG